MIGMLRLGKTIEVDQEWDGWVRTAEPFEKGKHGWMLLDGTRLGKGMGKLLAKVPT